MTWKLVYTKQAQKDAKKLASSGLKPKAQELLSLLAKVPSALLRFCHRLWRTLGLTAPQPIARFSGVVGNGNDYSFFWQLNGDYIVWEAFQNQALCAGSADIFGER